MATIEGRLDLEGIRERCKTATEGPWNHANAPLDHEGCATWPWYEREDMEFAYHAREDIPALLAEIDRLWATTDGLVGELERAAKDWIEAHAFEPDDYAADVWQKCAERLLEILARTRRGSGEAG